MTGRPLPLVLLHLVLHLVLLQVRGLAAAPRAAAEQDMMAVTVSAGPISVMEAPLSTAPSDQVSPCLSVIPQRS